MSTELRMPKLGESVVEGTVSKWLKQEGDEIKEYDPLLEISTDKVDTEIPSPASGIILKILVPEGETVGIDTPLCLIGQPGEALDAPPVVQPKAVAVASVGGNGQSTPAKQETGRGKRKGLHITPVVARIAAEHGVDVSALNGTGSGGRVTKKDILAYIEEGKALVPAVEMPAAPVAMPWDQPGSGDLFAPTDKIFERAAGIEAEAAPTLPVTPPAPTAPSLPFGEIIPFTGMRKSIADHMVHSKRTSPHVTSVMEVDCSNMVNFYQQHKEAFQERVGLKLTFTPIFVAAVAEGLRAVPLVNSMLTERGIELQRQINIGVAVALDEGLIVPVIKNADGLNLTGLQRAVTDLAARARSKRLTPDDVQGGTFTISNHGVAGSLFASPIINQPQVGILGVGKIEKRVVVVTHNGVDSIAIKPMCYLSFTFDHRILDGASGDKFLGAVKHAVENWR